MLKHLCPRIIYFAFAIYSEEEENIRGSFILAKKDIIINTDITREIMLPPLLAFKSGPAKTLENPSSYIRLLSDMVLDFDLINVKTMATFRY